ncbi:DUF2155 domain-containing protein [Candidatus Pelagibacter sp.]|jgi:hypothetical protein|nr:DUF2155 domain-containing protein [Candidatus Pelagibacter sp.]|tara:strand:- start:339 stop:746 length:408 start_codon:yes stop_codon:yes gene_type:complete
MQIKKNIKPGKVNYLIFFLILFLSFFLILNSNSKNINEGNYTDIKVLDKISSKNILIKLKNGEVKKYKDLMIKSMKCKNSEFDDNPEITAYLQVQDLTNKDKDDVYVFNGWMFSSSPSIRPFDHPVYDIWLVNCY